MQYYIYKITNNINGKMYIGQHKVPKKEESFYRYMGKGIAIRGAIKKYGKENFSKEIIEYIDDDDKHLKVSEREIFWISELDTMYPKGYNLSPGGEGGCTKEAAAKGVATKRKNGTNRMSEETKKKMSAAAKGRKFSEEHKNNLSKNHHLKTKWTIVFEDGHNEITTDSLVNIAKRFGTSQNTLIRYSAKNKFINGIKIEGIKAENYACCHTYKSKYEGVMCKDPILNDICTFRALRLRKYKNPNKYKDVILEEHIVDKQNDVKK